MEKRKHCKNDDQRMGMLHLIEAIEELHCLKPLDAIKALLRADQEGRIIILDAPRQPLVEGRSVGDTDVYCPHCDTNLSGINSEWDESIRVLQCPHCGTYLDSTSVIRFDEMREEKLKYAGEIGEAFGCFWQNGSYYCIERNGNVFEYQTLDALLIDWLHTIKEANRITHDWDDVIEFIHRQIPMDGVTTRAEQ